MFVAVARITLSIPEAGSLKSKRHVVHKVVDKVKARFNVSIAEVDDNDLWQKATLGIAAVANDHAFAQESVDKVARFIEELYVAPVIACSTEVVPLGKELYGEDDGTSFGTAARGAHRTLAEAERDAAMRDGDEVPDFDLPPAPMPARSARNRSPAGARGGGRPMSEGERQHAIEELRQRLREERRQAALGGDDDEDEG